MVEVGLAIHACTGADPHTLCELCERDHFAVLGTSPRFRACSQNAHIPLPSYRLLSPCRPWRSQRRAMALLSRASVWPTPCQHYRCSNRARACAPRCAPRHGASKLPATLACAANSAKPSRPSPGVSRKKPLTQSARVSPAATPPPSHPTAATGASTSSTTAPGRQLAVPATRRQLPNKSRTTEQLCFTPSRGPVPGRSAASVLGEGDRASPAGTRDGRRSDAGGRRLTSSCRGRPIPLLRLLA
jgi:hypothetical protein